MEKNTKISIAIPTYEMGGVGSTVLSKCLQSINEQTYKNIEIVISDQSFNDEIKKVCKEFSDLNLIYLKNENNRGNFSSNLNNAMKNCTGEIIKFLMQDDYLYTPDAIEKMVVEFNNNSNLYWMACGCAFGYSENNPHTMVPEYSEDIIKSRNTIGSPSTVAIRNNNKEYFDESMQWVVDLDYYKRMYTKFGLPIIIPDQLVFVLQHNNQISTTLNDEIKQKEQNELFERYK